ncbi:unnamed protein product, partial [Polarella glacialis]
VIELESSTPKKFSKHVLVQRLQVPSGEGSPTIHQSLAFANNAQAGAFVSELLAYARAKRDEPGSVSGGLFLRPPPSSVEGREDREVSLIDESVYS